MSVRVVAGLRKHADSRLEFFYIATNRTEMSVTGVGRCNEAKGGEGSGEEVYTRNRTRNPAPWPAQMTTDAAASYPSASTNVCVVIRDGTATSSRRSSAPRPFGPLSESSSSSSRG